MVVSHVLYFIVQIQKKHIKQAELFYSNVLFEINVCGVTGPAYAGKSHGYISAMP